MFMNEHIEALISYSPRHRPQFVDVLTHVAPDDIAEAAYRVGQMVRKSSMANDLPNPYRVVRMSDEDLDGKDDNYREHYAQSLVSEEIWAECFEAGHEGEPRPDVEKPPERTPIEELEIPNIPAMTKDEIEAWAKDKLGFDADRRKSKANMVAEVVAEWERQIEEAETSSEEAFKQVSPDGAD